MGADTHVGTRRPTRRRDVDLQLDHGFDSPSGFRDAFARIFGTPPSGARGIDCLYAKWLETPLGAMLALANDDGLHLLEFVDRLSTLSGGKPTGFKLAMGHPWEWFAVAKAMQESGIRPDFIVIDGGEGGTGAAPLEFTDHVGAPLREARKTFEREYLRAQIRRFSGNISKTATFIGMERSALHRKLKALGLGEGTRDDEDGEG